MHRRDLFRLLARLVGLQQHLDGPERILVAEHRDRRAGRDRDARGDGVERSVRIGVQRQPARHVGALRQRREIDVAQVQLHVDDRRLQRLAGALLPQLHGAVRRRCCPPNSGPASLSRRSVPRSRPNLATSSGSLRAARADALDVGLAADARIFEAAVGLRVDARALGDRRQAQLVEQPRRDRRRPRPAPRRSSGVRDSTEPFAVAVAPGDGDRQPVGLHPIGAPARRCRAMRTSLRQAGRASGA